jgi:hypothetical protein
MYQKIFFVGIFVYVVCPASAVSHARLVGAYFRNSESEFPRQREADISGKSVPHNEQTGELET